MTSKESDINQSIPEDLGALYGTLEREVQWLHAKWKIFYQLFVVSEERVKFLGNKAPGFFGIIQEVLRDDIFMALSRLTDPPRTGNKENLSLERFVEQLKESEESDFYRGVSKQLNRIQSHCKPFRDWRNRKIAHRDLPTALEYHPDPLPGINREMIEDALRMIAGLLNRVLKHFEDAETAYEPVFLRGDGNTIVHYLRQAEKSLRSKKRK